MHRRAVSRDLIHAAAVRELIELGYSVADCAALGDDFPDLVIGKHGLDQLVELKTENRVRNGPVAASHLLRPGQSRFITTWRGAPVIVAYTAAAVHEQFCGRLQRLRITA